ncbi:hypothetical protein [Paucibacter soli]
MTTQQTLGDSHRPAWKIGLEDVLVCTLGGFDADLPLARSAA